jgi:hypothetical protein
MRWRYERWVKLYVREEGSFSQLPLYVRALAAELLKICDKDGRIVLCGKTPWDAIAFQLGADLSDRRLLKKHVPMLLKDGYLELAGGDLFVRNFTVAQTGVDRIRVEPPTRSARDSSTTETRPERQTDATETRVDHERDTRTEPTPQNEACLVSSIDLKRSEEIRDTPSAREDAVDKTARGNLAHEIWGRHRERYAALRAEGLSPNARPLHLHGEGLRELSDRLTLHRGSLAEMRADCEHVLATREAQARSRGDLDWFGDNIWRRDHFADSLNRRPESYSPKTRAPPRPAGAPIGAARARNDHGLGAKPFGEA